MAYEILIYAVETGTMTLMERLMKPLLQASEARGEARGEAQGEARAQERFEAWKRDQLERGASFVENEGDSEESQQ